MQVEKLKKKRIRNDVQSFLVPFYIKSVSAFFVVIGNGILHRQLLAITGLVRESCVVL